MYPGSKSFVQYMHYKCFLPVCGRSFKFLYLFFVCLVLFWGVLSKKALPTSRAQRCFPMFFSRCFIVLLEILLVYGVRYGLKFTFFRPIFSCSSTICWKDFFFQLSSFLCRKSFDHICVFCSSDLISLWHYHTVLNIIVL